MATVNMTPTQTSSLHPSDMSMQGPYFVWMDLVIADVVTAKGSAIADADVFQCLDIPPYTAVLFAGITCEATMTGTSTDLTVDLGITGVEVDNFVDGYDVDAAVAGDIAQAPAAYQPLIVAGTADTLDILIETMTGTWLTGTLRVWAIFQDLQRDRFRPGIAVRAS